MLNSFFGGASRRADMVCNGHFVLKIRDKGVGRRGGLVDPDGIWGGGVGLACFTSSCELRFQAAV